MAVTLNIKNDRKTAINPTNIETPVRKNSRFVDLKMDLQLLRVGNPYYFDQKLVNGTDIDIATDEEAIRQYLINLFSCAPGDLYLDPEFGLNLKKFVFEPVTTRTAQLIGDTIERSIIDMTDGVFETSKGRNENFTLQNVFITVKEEQSAFDIEVLFYIKPLDREIRIFGNISPINGVYFYSK
jgi:hypothetical protein